MRAETQNPTALEPPNSKPILSRAVAAPKGVRRQFGFAIGCLGLVSLSAIVAALPGPLHSAIQIGGDEFFEVTKALLWTHGYPPYGKVWNDQPALHTAILAVAFKLFSPSIAVARGLAVAFGVSMFVAFALLLKKSSGAVAAFVASTFLVMAPLVFWLSISVMLEVPAIGTALWASFALFRWKDTKCTPWLVLSAFLLAAAMQMKATAAILAPAMVLDIWLAENSDSFVSRARRVLKVLILWGGTFLVFYLLLGVALGENYDRLWASHFSSQMMDELDEFGAHAFSVRFLLDHTEALWGLGVGLFVIGHNHQWKTHAFPLALLLTVTAIHMHHRPWWPYYYLHFAIPIAWLAGIGIAGLLQGSVSPSTSIIGKTTSLLLGLAMLSLALFCGGTRLYYVLQKLWQQPRVEDSALVHKMIEYRRRTKWVFSRGSIYAFHAGLPTIPELAVIPAKRIWSGRLTETKILSILEQYRPEQLLLEKWRKPPEWREFIKLNYTPAFEDEQYVLYVSNAIR